MEETAKLNTKSYNEKYLCNGCGAVVILNSNDTVLCKICGSRIFRKERTKKIIRIRGR